MNSLLSIMRKEVSLSPASYFYNVFSCLCNLFQSPRKQRYNSTTISKTDFIFFFTLLVGFFSNSKNNSPIHIWKYDAFHGDVFAKKLCQSLSTVGNRYDRRNNSPLSGREESRPKLTLILNFLSPLMFCFFSSSRPLIVQIGWKLMTSLSPKCSG